MGSPVIPERRWTGRRGLLRLLEELAEPGRCLRTAYRSPQDLRGESAGLARSLDAAVETARRWGTGLAVFHGLTETTAVVPPFPLEAGGDYEGLNDGPLRSLLSEEPTVAVVLLRLGRYAVGLFHGEGLRASKSGGRYVKGRHRAGGQSQGRFQRGREGQARHLYDRACQDAQRTLEPFARDIRWVLLGGDAHVLRGFLERCAFLETLPVLGRRLDVRRPGMAGLEEAGAQLWRGRLFLYREGHAERTDGSPAGQGRT